LKAQSDALANTDNSVKSSARKSPKSPSSKASMVDVAQQSQEDRRLYISIYKAKVGSDILGLARQMSDFFRAILNSWHNIQCPPSNHAKFELYSIESKALLSQRWRSK
jgi:hypothetical protein